ncbi:MAG: type II toxin-antitoxin system VapC family toxin [Deltaproteobacteria bacterium]|jgi:PIN domain nuclease of toxin-antitoxin system|nr:type II toxin-antitoxin system VapC family toxin [Deltaproteobacteria bacterium]
MKILLDTHTLLWMLSDGEQLSDCARNMILDHNNELFFSLVSYWEICVKQSLGKLQLADNWQKKIDQELLYNGIRWLQIETNHCTRIIKLPFHHCDPFDRLLIAQAICEKMQILTKNKHVSMYKIKTIW